MANPGVESNVVVADVGRIRERLKAFGFRRIAFSDAKRLGFWRVKVLYYRPLFLIVVVMSAGVVASAVVARARFHAGAEAIGSQAMDSLQVVGVVGRSVVGDTAWVANQRGGRTRKQIVRGERESDTIGIVGTIAHGKRGAGPAVKGEAETFVLRGIEALRAIWLICASLIVVIQWQVAREDASIDKFFDRLRKNNEQLLEYEPAWRYARAATKVTALETMTDEKRDRFTAAMYVFAELDSLEYCYLKYFYGFMTEIEASRGCEIFLSRCDDERFREDAREFVASGRYEDGFRKVVRAMVERVSRGDASGIMENVSA